jgi:hypothetical protein
VHLREAPAEPQPRRSFGKLGVRQRVEHHRLAPRRDQELVGLGIPERERAPAGDRDLRPGSTLGCETFYFDTTGLAGRLSTARRRRGRLRRRAWLKERNPRHCVERTRRAGDGQQGVEVDVLGDRPAHGDDARVVALRRGDQAEVP